MICIIRAKTGYSFCLQGKPIEPSVLRYYFVRISKGVELNIVARRGGKASGEASKTTIEPLLLVFEMRDDI